MSINKSGIFPKKYSYDQLEIGESMEVTGIEGNIRSAASMWGTRFGIWLSVTKIDDGIMKVTRVNLPRLDKHSRMDKLEKRVDAISDLLRLVLNLNSQKI